MCAESLNRTDPAEAEEIVQTIAESTCQVMERLTSAESTLRVLKKSNKISKNAEFYADFRTVEKVAKNALTKSYTETNLMNMSKSGKSTFFHHIFANPFFVYEYICNFFNSFGISIKDCVF